MQWYSKESEQDRWVIETVFAGRKEPGFFVETGAADGVSACDTYALEKHFGWTGILVEPNRLLFDKLRKNRRCIAENLCLAEADGEVEFIEASWFGRIREHALHALPDGDHLNNPYLSKDLDGSPAQLVRKPAMTLRTLLDKHAAPRRIDFMSIDAEGSEWQILSAFPFDRYEIMALAVDTKMNWEGKILDAKNADKVRQLLRDHGYLHDVQRSRGLKDDFFLHRSLEHKLQGHP